MTSVAEEANAPSVGNNRACSNERSGENKYSSGKRTRGRTGNRDVPETRPLCNGGRPREELLYLWGFWAHGLPLQEQGKREANRGKENRV